MPVYTECILCERWLAWAEHWLASYGHDCNLVSYFRCAISDLLEGFDWLFWNNGTTQVSGVIYIMQLGFILPCPHATLIQVLVTIITIVVDIIEMGNLKMAFLKTGLNEIRDDIVKNLTTWIHITHTVY